MRPDRYKFDYVLWAGLSIGAMAIFIGLVVLGYLVWKMIGLEIT